MSRDEKQRMKHARHACAGTIQGCIPASTMKAAFMTCFCLKTSRCLKHLTGSNSAKNDFTQLGSVLGKALLMLLLSHHQLTSHMK